MIGCTSKKSSQEPLNLCNSRMGANKVGLFFLSIIVSFAIIYFAVRLAIRPLLYKPDEIDTSNQSIGLVKLRDIGVLSNNELEEVIKLFKNKGNEKEDYEQYNKYVKLLNQLNKMDYFNDEERLKRLHKLKEYFKINY